MIATMIVTSVRVKPACALSRVAIPVCTFFFSSRRRHTRLQDWSSDVCSSDLFAPGSGRRRGSDRDRARLRLPLPAGSLRLAPPLAAAGTPGRKGPGNRSYAGHTGFDPATDLDRKSVV